MTNFLTLVWRAKFYILLAGVLVWLQIARMQADAAHRAEIAALQKTFNDQTSAMGMLRGTIESQKQLFAGLSKDNQALAAKIKALGGSIASHTSGTATVDATHVPGAVVPATATADSYWQDSHKRFTLNLKTFDFTQHQKFAIDAVVYRGPDGKTVVQSTGFYEISPVTGNQIEGSNVKAEWKLEIADAPTVEVPAFHLRALAVIGSEGFGPGLQFWNLKDRFNMSAVALYSPVGKTLFVGIAPGWRLVFPFLNSNLSVGPLAGYRVLPAPGSWRFGVQAGIELSR